MKRLSIILAFLLASCTRLTSHETCGFETTNCQPNGPPTSGSGSTSGTDDAGDGVVVSGVWKVKLDSSWQAQPSQNEADIIMKHDVTETLLLTKAEKYSCKDQSETCKSKFVIGTSRSMDAESTVIEAMTTQVNDRDWARIESKDNGLKVWTWIDYDVKTETGLVMMCAGKSATIDLCDKAIHGITIL
jgi:hypothetical protein